eukprot:5292231-Amphidinium_carterae.1
MSRSTWMHVSRRLWKDRQLVEASSRICEEGDRPLLVDIESTQRFMQDAPAHAVDTVQVGGVNSMDRQWRHFRKGEGICEHKCGTDLDGPGLADTFWHKVCQCRATQALRTRPGIQSSVDTLSTLPQGFREHFLVPWVFAISPYTLSLRAVHVFTPDTLKTHLDAASLADAQGGIGEVQ